MNKRMVTQVKLQLPFQTILLRNAIFFAIVLGALVLVKRSYSILIKPWTWYILSMVVFFICTGGVVHTVIHQTPWFKFGMNEYGQQYVVEYFMRGQRGQWAGEGYIVSTLTTLGAISATIVGVSHKFEVSDATRRLIIMFSLVGLVGFVQFILMAYRIKSPWYGPSFFPPEDYRRGPLSADQGNNI